VRLAVVVIRRAVQGYAFLGDAGAIFADDEEPDDAEHKDHSAHERPRPNELHLGTVA
jgi:hypothetical protein